MSRFPKTKKKPAGWVILPRRSPVFVPRKGNEETAYIKRMFRFCGPDEGSNGSTLKLPFRQVDSPNTAKGTG